ncbi:MAG: hypothetical protein ACLPN5_13755 [Roseiarcus sp.]
MRLKVTEVENGLHPTQVVLSINAEDGVHFVVLNRKSVVCSTIEVGHWVGRRGEFYLVELPSETDSGAWRLWVNKSEIAEQTLEAAE